MLWVVICVGVGWTVRAPLLEGGLASDDFVHEAMLDGVFAQPRNSLDLFDFASGQRLDNDALMAAGNLPFWTHPELKLSMFRPAASLLVQLDRVLLKDDPRARHALSFLVFGLLVVAVAALYRHWLPPWAGALALLCFVLDEAHTLPLAWLAHRGALCALLLGVIAFGLHLRVSAWAAWASGLCFALALCFGEWALPMLGYFVAHALFVQRGLFGRRIARLLPVLVPTASYLLLRGLTGHGVAHSGIYIDALSNPLGFVGALFVRVPVLTADLVFSVAADRYLFASPFAQLAHWPALHVGLGYAAIALAFAMAWLAASACSRVERARVGALACGALLSMVFTAGAFATSRLVMPAAIGYCAVVWLCVRALSLRLSRDRGPRRFLAAIGCALLLYLAVFEAWRSVTDEVSFLGRLYPGIRRSFVELKVDDSELPSKRLILLNTLDHTTQVFGAYVLHAVGRPIPKSMWTLSVADSAQLMERLDDKRLRVTLLSSGLLSHPFARLYRDLASPLRTGHRVQLPGALFTIMHAKSGNPTAFELTLQHSADDPRYVFLASTAGGLQPLSIPPVGQSLLVPRPVLPLID